MTYIESLIIPKDDGTFTYQITISASFTSRWTSPEIPLKATTWEEAREEARREAEALGRAISTT